MNVSRRHFLMGSLGAVASAGLTSWRGAASPNEKVIVGVMGIRGRGAQLAQLFAKRSDVEVAYLADVDSRLFADRAKSLEQFGKKPRCVMDFRRVLDDKDVDAIVMATPDHWHALATIWACQADKDVYVEKPVSHSIWEGRKMVEAARKYQRVVQVGAQNRSAPYVTAAIEHIRSGKLGDVHFVRVFNSKGRGTIGKLPNKPTPDGVDYNMWLGPAKLRPFNENHFHYAWHWFWEYSGGDIINDGVHQIDMARWVAGVNYPKSVSSTGGIHFFNDDQETPDTHVVNWDFDKITMSFEQALWAPYMRKTPMELRDRDVLPNWTYNGTRVELYGTKQHLVLGRHGDGWQVFDAEGKSVTQSYGRQANDEHIANFVDCIRSRKLPNGDVEEVHLSTLLCHYGNISYRLGRKLKIDPKTEGFVDDAEASRLVKRQYRQPWVVPENV